MKRYPFTPRWLVIGFIVLLVLSACERPIPGTEGTDSPDTAEPVEEPVVIPTALPTDVPSEPATDAESGEPVNAGTDAETPAEEPAVEEPAAEEPAAEEPTTEQPADTTGDATTPTDTGDDKSHTVQPGDTLSQIAESYGVTTEELAAANGIANFDTLDVGQVLVIPVPGSVDTTPPSTEERTHVVKAGENLFRIGLAYGYTIEVLTEYNGLANPNSIEVGQVIRIPPSE